MLALKTMIRRDYMPNGYSPGDELSSLDFSSIIGGALNAVIVAQAQSSKTSVDFIKKVGFNPGKDENSVGDPVYASFTYPKEVAPAIVKEDGSIVPAMYQNMEMKVPLLTMMPIPFIRIANAEVDFNVKINSVSSTEQSSSQKLDAEAKLDASLTLGPFKATVSVKANVANQKQSSSSEKISKDYSLHINVKAVQDDMPAGISRLLDILEDSMLTKSVGAPAREAPAA